MITIEILSEQKKQIPKYPYVGKHYWGSSIVLFTSPKKGICLAGNYIISNEDYWCENEFQPVDITIKSTI